VTGKFQASTPVNPLSLLSDPGNFTYVTEWLSLAIEDDSFSLSPQQRQDMFEAVKLLASYSADRWTLSSLSTMLHSDLRERLQIWLVGGQYGHFFDHVEDAFAVSDNLCIECGELFQKFPRAAALFTDYAFYRISQSMDGIRYTVIEVEECGFFFQNERFYKRFEDWITTIRKLNGSIWAATQSLRQIARVANFEILKENIANWIYLPNSQAKTSPELYGEKFGLTDQIQMISDAVPNRDYLWITSTQTRMLQTAFNDEMVAMLRSDGVAQSICDTHYASGEPGLARPLRARNARARSLTRENKVKKWIANIAVAASVFGASSAHAALPVTDWVGLVQTTISALQSIKSEVYENTNIVYQYQMMANQLLQATGLDVSDITEQFNSIKDDIGKYEVYGNHAQGPLRHGVRQLRLPEEDQSMVVASGKTKEQWFEDQRSS
jgi:hypothetical protein